MKYSTALLIGSIMASCLLMPFLIGISFAFYAFDVPYIVSSIAIFAIALLCTKLLAPRVRSFAEMYR